MRAKLQKFTAFSQTLFPHETAYLLNIAAFQDPVRLRILERVHQNCQTPHSFASYDTSIDKRKYSSLKTWIQSKLKAIDVDQQFQWVNRIEEQILTGNLSAKTEKKWIQAIQAFSKPCFFFTQFFETVRQYRHFQILQQREEDLELVEHFLSSLQTDYAKALRINEKIHEATSKIARLSSKSLKTGRSSVEWLTSVFFNEELDGHNRYSALMGLTLFYFNTRNIKPLPDKFDYLEDMLISGEYYSRRILITYYSHRHLLHTLLEEPERAAYYQQLCTRGCEKS